MRTIFSDDQLLHHGRGELNEGRIDPAFEKPARAEIILRRIHEVGLGVVLEPDPFERGPIERVHAPDYVDFLEGAWDDWVAEHGDEVDALPLIWPVRTLRQKCPRQIDGRMSWYAMDAGTPITNGTWPAITASASVALTGARLIDEGERAVFSLCRPPGHHAATDLLGGYCYLNNAAIAAQSLIDRGASRVVVLDIDYHHGNGTQAIFYERPDVLFLSIHADPADEFPYFLGYADEIGVGPGEGANGNWPLPLGTGRDDWMEALDQACARGERFGADALVVSLGVDTFHGDPISQFTLDTADFPAIGARIARLGLPTLFVMEGGYAVEEIGINAVGVLTGFDGA
ncbi:histone deacetylase family protein [Halofilum ochraceum]|uniref:histone deacetylase family protein n=1 Tax=Halofilum ochraceum TaxID=1611323 RepID=UPI00082F9ED7|nr:histone deacetylase family protein [Halofilum ochraceum]